MIQIQFDVQVGFDLRQIATEMGVRLVLFEFRLPAFFHLIDVFVDVVERAVFFEQGNGGLFTNARHAGDVIGLVADDGFVIHDLRGQHAKFFEDILILDVILVIAREIHDRTLVDKLQQIAVAGDDLDAESLFVGDVRHRAEHIICLEAFHFEAWNIERIHHLTDSFDLRAQVVGHFFAGGFIFREKFVAEGLADIERHREVFRLFLLEDAEQFARKAINSRCGFAF